MLGNHKVVGEATTTIHRPVESVFRFIADEFEANYPRWSPEVIELKVLSAGYLDRDWFARQTRVDQGHKTTSTFRVADIQRPTRIVFSGVSAEFVCTYTLERVGPSNESARLRFRFEFPRLELRMRPFRKLIQTSVQEGAERTVYNLKGLVEQVDGSTAP
ncbi:SRPBCC family protein [Aquisalimonas sp.]|uniref:SRPBCC family protein n=1 Tax=Aquisalimonas sp. TaxID=1872621 RepID=UPI0025C5C459|nr:SRPBCC family protein [Aquisalimonas sp.]